MKIGINIHENMSKYVKLDFSQPVGWLQSRFDNKGINTVAQILKLKKHRSQTDDIIGSSLKLNSVNAVYLKNG